MALGALAGFIPKIEGFAPLPSATADAFMAMQGGHMALYFGAEYTIGKRLIASMSNEDFNASVKTPSFFINKIEPHYKVITEAFESHLNQHIDRIQNLVLDKAYELEILKIHQNVKLIKELPSAYFSAIFSLNDRLEDSQGANKGPGEDDRRDDKGKDIDRPAEEIVAEDTQSIYHKNSLTETTISYFFIDHSQKDKTRKKNTSTGNAYKHASKILYHQVNSQRRGMPRSFRGTQQSIFVAYMSEFNKIYNKKWTITFQKDWISRR